MDIYIDIFFLNTFTMYLLDIFSPDFYQDF